PRVWGVTYPKLCATLGGGLLATTLGFVMTPGATAIVKLMVIGLGVAATLLGYGVCFLMDNTDRLESDSASFLKRELNSQSLPAPQLYVLHDRGGRPVARANLRGSQHRKTRRHPCGARAAGAS